MKEKTKDRVERGTIFTKYCNGIGNRWFSNINHRPPDGVLLEIIANLSGGCGQFSLPLVCSPITPERSTDARIIDNKHFRILVGCIFFLLRYESHSYLALMKPLQENVMQYIEVSRTILHQHHRKKKISIQDNV
uniref:Uncharacterized protein n=1 Tax=Glossina austeni TaxID=7395 RepID=A0A1A9UU01_GLOAU